jgi:ABC-type antimicrobial peptide transport system permease subunit
VGLAVGVVLSIGASGAVESLLYRVAPRDPVIRAGVVLVLAGAAAVACLLPAIRAARADPVRTLRAE